MTAELLDGIGRGIAALGGVKRSKLGRPLKIPRPGDIARNNQPKTKAATSYLEIARSLLKGR